MNILFGFGLAGAGALAAAMPAGAADIYRREPVSIKDTPVDYAPAITWSGFYLGGNIGAVWPDSDEVELFDNDAKLIGGGHLGFNWQSPSNWVLGVEAEDVVEKMKERDFFQVGEAIFKSDGEKTRFMKVGEIRDIDAYKRQILTKLLRSDG